MSFFSKVGNELKKIGSRVWQIRILLLPGFEQHHHALRCNVRLLGAGRARLMVCMAADKTNLQWAFQHAVQFVWRRETTRCRDSSAAVVLKSP
jgi:hypothetical protein